jgi:hypothetical protein
MIANPDKSGSFIFTDTVEDLWYKFITAWHKPSLNSPSVYGKVQHIVNNF